MNAKLSDGTIVSLAQIVPLADGRCAADYTRDGCFAFTTTLPNEAQAAVFVRTLNAELVEHEPARVVGGCGDLMSARVVA